MKVMGWTTEEESLLEYLVSVTSMVEDADWDEVVELIRESLPKKKNITRAQCKARWTRIFLGSRPWSREDDSSLCKLIRNVGPSWSMIADGFGRTKTSVSDRWVLLVSTGLVDREGRFASKMSFGSLVQHRVAFSFNSSYEEEQCQCRTLCGKQQRAGSSQKGPSIFGSRDIPLTSLLTFHCIGFYQDEVHNAAGPIATTKRKCESLELGSNMRNTSIVSEEVGESGKKLRTEVRYKLERPREWSLESKCELVCQNPQSPTVVSKRTGRSPPPTSSATNSGRTSMIYYSWSSAGDYCD
jgi:hypothetical protein